MHLFKIISSNCTLHFISYLVSEVKQRQFTPQKKDFNLMFLLEKHEIFRLKITTPFFKYT
ncbi:hypothetical protein BBB56_10310 [Candidatus Pantoea deserta]|uniref:Uncharacterized protein n=1 Tax=Candidatus Pantoea deserta TaxID=1869313 RepID=A0A3N4NXX9_9GAMM|nr:hypothetical protein BBB56_10310 [Pantoea deserta]